MIVMVAILNLIWNENKSAQCNFTCDDGRHVIKTRSHCVTTHVTLCSHGEFHCMPHHKSRTCFYFLRSRQRHCLQLRSGRIVRSLIFEKLHATSHMKLLWVSVPYLTLIEFRYIKTSSNCLRRKKHAAMHWRPGIVSRKKRVQSLISLLNQDVTI